MKWLHLSDIHFNPEKDEVESLFLRKKLIDFLKEKEIIVDKVFLTGDYRDASCQAGSDEAAANIAKYILDVACTVGVNDVENILFVPGNHDLQRDFANRQEIIYEEKQRYDANNGTIRNLDTLIDSFVFYRKVLEQIKGKKYTDSLFEYKYKINPHPLIVLENVCVLLLNTELLVGEKIEMNGNTRVLDDRLFVGTRYVINSLDLLESTKKPIIVLAHRGLDFLEPLEQRKLLKIFNDYNVCIYLCGHSNDLWCDDIHNLPQITMGCIKQQDGVKAGFSIGEYDDFNRKIIVEAYSWDNDMWKEYNHFDADGYKKVWELDEKLSINEDDNINTLKIVIGGVVREFQCKNVQIEHSIEHGNVLSIATGRLIAQIKKDDYSNKIRADDRFVLSGSVWKVIGIDNTSKKIITITCYKDFINPWTDDMENGVASMDKIIQ